MYPPDYRLLSHPYTDRPQDGSMAVCCYAFEEAFGEKIRALGERARPRDLYDVINLFRTDVFPPQSDVNRRQRLLSSHVVLSDNLPRAP